MTDPYLQELLVKTSRTFALSIPTLPEPTREEVTVAYLLFRIADTFEDSSSWDKARKVQALEDFSALLADPAEARTRELAASWAGGEPIAHEGYQELLRASPQVLDTYQRLAPNAREAIRHFVTLTNEGMARTVLRTDDTGWLALFDLQDLRDYCYIVAGLVGEMLTELYIHGVPSLAACADDLRGRARWFGEGLQLVNILKDSRDDAAEGRSFLPAGVDRAQVFALARDDLGQAAEYVTRLHEASAPRGILAFNAMPLLLAWSTLDRVERDGPGAKLTRDEVFALVARLNSALDRGEVLVTQAAARG